MAIFKKDLQVHVWEKRTNYVDGITRGTENLNTNDMNSEKDLRMHNLTVKVVLDRNIWREEIHCHRLKHGCYCCSSWTINQYSQMFIFSWAENILMAKLQSQYSSRPKKEWCFHQIWVFTEHLAQWKKKLFSFAEVLVSSAFVKTQCLVPNEIFLSQLFLTCAERYTSRYEILRNLSW